MLDLAAYADALGAQLCTVSGYPTAHGAQYLARIQGPDGSQPAEVAYLLGDAGGYTGVIDHESIWQDEGGYAIDAAQAAAADDTPHCYATVEEAAEGAWRMLLDRRAAAVPNSVEVDDSREWIIRRTAGSPIAERWDIDTEGDEPGWSMIAVGAGDPTFLPGEGVPGEGAWTTDQVVAEFPEHEDTIRGWSLPPVSDHSPPTLRSHDAMMRVAPVSFRPGPIIGPELEARATPDTQVGTVAKTMLATHLEVIAIGHKLMPELTIADLSLIADAVNGLWIGDEHGSAAGGWQTMWAEVADHIRLNQAAEHHGVTDPDGLVRRLQGMDSACKVALADAMRRFWSRDRQNGESVIDQFRAVGLAPHGA